LCTHHFPTRTEGQSRGERLDPLAILSFVIGGVVGLILGLRAGREGGKEVDEVVLKALGVTKSLPMVRVSLGVRGGIRPLPVIQVCLKRKRRRRS